MPSGSPSAVGRFFRLIRLIQGTFSTDSTSYFSFFWSSSTAFFNATGNGTPSSPAFSIMESNSLQQNPIQTASLTYDVPSITSSRTATTSGSSTTPFFKSPFQPTLLDSHPVLLLGDFPHHPTANPVA